MKLIILGDNLTSWANYLEGDLVNLATDDATNETQILAMHDYLFDNDIKYTDIFIWQLASSSNPTNRFGPTLEETQEPCKYYNYITNLKKNQTNNFNTSEEEQLAEIYSLLTTIRKWTDRILVLRGWKEVLSPEKTKAFGKMLTENKIKFISESNLEWCSSQNLFFNTDGTPSEDSQIKFCNEIILPKLKEII